MRPCGAPGARVEDTSPGGRSLSVASPAVLSTHRVAEVPAVLGAVEEAARRGWWSVGFVSYDAAAAFDPALDVAGGLPGLAEPLAWFAVGRAEPLGAPAGPARHWCGPWRADHTPQQWVDAVAVVREELAAGTTYEVNLTTTLRAPFEGSPVGLHAGLLAAQGRALGVWCDTGRHVVAGASPELFFETDGALVRCRPMKGTAARTGDGEADVAAREALRRGAKERCENVIVVDLVRNDLGRVAVPGTVRVRSLADVEAYPTVWQLTSTIEARVGAGTTLVDLFGALHPSGSITGAPKASTMRVIARLEGRRRGVYCGAVGWVGPPVQDGAVPQCRFAVGIRTAVVDRVAAEVSYGVGAGIVWDSVAEAEWCEVLAKAAILPGRGPTAGRLRVRGGYGPAHRANG